MLPAMHRIYFDSLQMSYDEARNEDSLLAVSTHLTTQLIDLSTQHYQFVTGLLKNSSEIQAQVATTDGLRKKQMSKLVGQIRKSSRDNLDEELDAGADKALKKLPVVKKTKKPRKQTTKKVKK